MLRIVADQAGDARPGGDAAWGGLGADPGLCRACQHPKLNQTRRGTTYLRCTRAEWDSTLPRYPRLPVIECAGFDRKPAR
jgi:hypothetical protein